MVLLGMSAGTVLLYTGAASVIYGAGFTVGYKFNAAVRLTVEAAIWSVVIDDFISPQTDFNIDKLAVVLGATGLTEILIRRVL